MINTSEIIRSFWYRNPNRFAAGEGGQFQAPSAISLGPCDIGYFSSGRVVSGVFPRASRPSRAPLLGFRGISRFFQN